MEQSLFRLNLDESMNKWHSFISHSSLNSSWISQNDAIVFCMISSSSTDLRYNEPKFLHFSCTKYTIYVVDFSFITLFINLYMHGDISNKILLIIMSNKFIYP